jgi:hypothetical protein
MLKNKLRKIPFLKRISIFIKQIKEVAEEGCVTAGTNQNGRKRVPGTFGLRLEGLRHWSFRTLF